VALPSTMPRHSSTAEGERRQNSKSSARPVGADSSAIAVDALASQPRSAASSAAACSTGRGTRTRVRFWGRAPASKVGAAGGGDVKAPDQEEELIKDAEVASAVLQCPGQVAGGASNTPAPSKGPASHRGVKARMRAIIRRPVGLHFTSNVSANSEFCFQLELLKSSFFIARCFGPLSVVSDRPSSGHAPMPRRGARGRASRLPRGVTSSCCSGRAARAHSPPGKQTRAARRPLGDTSSCCNGRAPRAPLGTRPRAITRPRPATWRCCNGRAPRAPLGASGPWPRPSAAGTQSSCSGRALRTPPRVGPSDTTPCACATPTGDLL